MLMSLRSLLPAERDPAGRGRECDGENGKMIAGGFGNAVCDPCCQKQSFRLASVCTALLRVESSRVEPAFFFDRR